MGGIRIISDKNGTYGVEISSFYSGKKIHVNNKNEDISIIFFKSSFFSLNCSDTPHLSSVYYNITI